MEDGRKCFVAIAVKNDNGVSVQENTLRQMVIALKNCGHPKKDVRIGF